MTVTVIVPAYNIGRYIGACLQSVIDQTDVDWTCLVIDDGSTDDTVERVLEKNDPRITLIRQPNQGVSAARNNGLSRVTTPFVMFLDGDDILHPAALGRLTRALQEAPDSVLSFGALRKMLADGSPYPGDKPLHMMHYPSGDVLRSMLRENFLANGGQAVIRTGPVQEVGGFNSALRLSEDWELWCRLAIRGHFLFVGATPEIFTLRVMSGSSSGSLSAIWANHEAAITAVLSNQSISSRFSPEEWKTISGQIKASHKWEAGRVNFTLRKFSIARSLMLQSLSEHPTPKRLVLFLIAQLSAATNVSLVSRLRFRDQDEAIASQN